MLEVFINFICAYLLAITGFFIIKKIINSDKKLDINSLFVLFLNSILVVIIHYIEYNVFSSFLNFIINTITYKIIFKSSLEESFIETGILTLLLLISDVIVLIIQLNFTNIIEIQNNVYIYLLSNLLVIFIIIVLLTIPPVKNIIHRVYKCLEDEEKVNAIFIVIVIIIVSSVLYKMFNIYKLNGELFSDILILIMLIIIGIIYLINREKYSKLMNEYDNLFIYVQNFEEWIEKEQLNRHEYKNQLAVLYALSNESSVRNKIKDILSDNLNIEKEVIHQLKNLPKGGIKGLMYYKAIIAQNNKINLTIDVSINNKGMLNQLKKEDRNTICKLIGIYFDNAIEAAKESRKKNILLEIYELKDKVNIVISNTYKKSSILKNQEEKGISTKGKGRGNGLYFARKIMKKNENNWLEEKHEIIDNYYIETITIKKKITSRK